MPRLIDWLTSAAVQDSRVLIHTRHTRRHRSLLLVALHLYHIHPTVVVIVPVHPPLKVVSVAAAAATQSPQYDLITTILDIPLHHRHHLSLTVDLSTPRNQDRTTQGRATVSHSLLLSNEKWVLEMEIGHGHLGIKHQFILRPSTPQHHPPPSTSPTSIPHRCAGIRYMKMAQMSVQICHNDVLRLWEIRAGIGDRGSYSRTTVHILST
ncbi:hypothetical protein SISSUDRAFT_1067503 [Sistotremastrum suecicum HHB10207 ss-3]|uniref:Uncharacterized protein n=1 Tax=Sistotremastrum suecicum HHB10207 ss-3 TaxID=1314776 RepID=A0A165X1N5_9AGAM|nr:hypothetical protein SISSUDRAFT_1067503 [Sistotremastrum suecicum HHB10207 ss-3]